MNQKLKYSLSRNKSLKNKTLIEQLFKQGKSISKYPIRLVYLQTDYDKNENFQVAFSVSKKKFKRAVDRNRIKRLMREAFRLQQQILDKEKKIIMMWIYTDNKLPDYQTVYKKIEAILKQLKQ